MSDVQIGDVWQWDERAHPSLLGQRRTVRWDGDRLATFDGDRNTGAAVDLHLHARLISRAGQPVTAGGSFKGCGRKIGDGPPLESCYCGMVSGGAIPFCMRCVTVDKNGNTQPVTAEHDRSGCRAWCGLTSVAIFEMARAVRNDYLDRPDFAVGQKDDAAARWCSARCRDLRLPSMGEKAEAVITSVKVDDHDVCPACVGLTVRHVTECPKRIREVQLLERTPSAVAAAPAPTRDTFMDLASEWDLLPDVR